MCLERIILSLILMQVATRVCVKGLQCYVCEDCNEYDDFKELHICGEISIEAAEEPTPIINTSKSTASLRPTAESSTNPTSHDLNEASAATQAKATTAKTAESIELQRSQSTQLATTPVTATSVSLTDLRLSTGQSTIQQSSVTKTNLQESTTADKIATSNASTSKPRPVLVPDYADYFEYEDERSSVKSLLKLDEPVCYMIKYRVNDTILTNRGCTTFTNGNKHSTCHSLYNGAHMESCQICSLNACNKFLESNSSGVPGRFGAVILLLWALSYCSIA